MRGSFSIAFVVLIGVLFCATGSLGGARPANAASFTVLNTNDSGPGSLRQAIFDANINGVGLDTIDATGVTGTITLTTGELFIFSDLIIIGPGANLLTVSGNGAVRIFDTSLVPALTNVTVSGMTLANGNSGTLNGGAINSRSPMTINDVAIINSVSGTPTDVGTGGGAIVIDRPLVMNRVTVSGNQALGNGAGGAIEAFNTTITLNNVTVSGNSTPGSALGVSEAGGIALFQATANLNNVTITGNSSGSNGGGGIGMVTSTVNARNTIIAGNTSTGAGPDCHAGLNSSFNSLGYNLIQNPAGCGIGGVVTGNKTGVSANLGPLANNGGPTQTHALLAGSPAIDAGDPAGCAGGGGLLTTDQRGPGFPRALDGDGNGSAICDMGAYEAPAVLIAAAPLLSKAFNPSTTGINGVTTLTFTLTNTGAVPLTGLAFIDNLLSGLRVNTTPGVTNNCGGAVTAVANSTSIALANGTLAANTNCVITVQVQATASGTIVNITGPLTSNEAPAGTSTGSATLVVSAATPSPTPTGTPSPTATATSVVGQAVIPQIPQVFQNPAAMAGVMSGLRSAATPQPRAAIAPARPVVVSDPPVLRPPNTGDAGLATP